MFLIKQNIEMLLEGKIRVQVTNPAFWFLYPNHSAILTLPPHHFQKLTPTIFDFFDASEYFEEKKL